jgi:heptose-I-phosphate ethanolaminephosphotransferase
MRNIREIPFLVWCSERFVARRPSLYERIQASAQRLVCSDDVAYLLFDLGGISFNWDDQARSVLSGEFRPHTTAIE